MSRINTNVSSLLAQQSLTNTENQLQKSMTRLSTGLQINSGSDNPSGLIASQALQSNITSIGQAVTNSQTAQQMISTADSALSQVSTLLNTIRGLVTASANTGALSSDQIAANQLQVDSALQAINQISQTTSFQGQKLLDGSLGFTTVAAGTNASGDTAANVKSLQINNAIASASSPLGVSVNITSHATQAAVTATIPVASAATAATATVNLHGGKSMVLTATTAGTSMNGVAVNFVQTSSIAAGAATAQFVASGSGTGGTLNIYVNSTAANAVSINTIATALTAGNTGFTAAAGAGSAGTDTYLVGTDSPATAAASTGTTGTATVSGTLTGPLVFQLTGSQGSQVFNFQSGTTGAQIASAINLQTSSTGISAGFATGTGVLTLTSQQWGSAGTIGVSTITDSNGFNSSLSATNAAGTDIAGNINGYTASGVGNTLSINTSSLAMSATVANGSSTSFSFNVTGGGAVFQLGPSVQTNQQTQLGIQAVNSGTLGNGNDGMLYTLGSGQTNSLANNSTQASTIIDDAISQVADLRGRLGAFESTTVDSNIASLNGTLTNLTAANSSIQDTDFASETAALTRAQILEQSGYSVLADANKDPQYVLKLLQ